MTAEFEIDESKMQVIADAFGLSFGKVKMLYDAYSDFAARMKGQYLAHVVRSMEDYVRQHDNAPLFRIGCKGVKMSALIKGLGTAFYKPKFAYDIIYDASLPPIDARVVIAHELGHLYWMVNSGQIDYDAEHEPISSVLGVFTIMDKNRFYSIADYPFQHKSWRGVLHSFETLRQRMQGKS